MFANITLPIRLTVTLTVVFLFQVSSPADDVIRERNRNAESREKDNVRDEFPLEKGYFVGFSRTIHFRDALRSIYEGWNGQWTEAAMRVSKHIYEDYERVKREASEHGADITSQEPVAKGQLHVTHWEGNRFVNTKTPRSWIFYAVWRIPGRTDDRASREDRLHHFLTDVDAAVSWVEGKGYFFKGDEYIRVNLEPYPNNTVDPGYPKKITEGRWHGWPDHFRSGIDAAVSWGDHAYFFKGNEYIRVKREPWPENTIDEDYPKQITDDLWPGWPAHFRSGIDAAVSWGDHAYFFKADEFIRVTRQPWPANVVDGKYPKKITDSRWPGWPDDFRSGIDAAINWNGVNEYGGKAYFIRRRNYSRGNVLPHPDNTTDPDYPKRLRVLIHP